VTVCFRHISTQSALDALLPRRVQAVGRPRLVSVEEWVIVGIVELIDQVLATLDKSAKPRGSGAWIKLNHAR
jgi:hypothetical protein